MASLTGWFRDIMGWDKYGYMTNSEKQVAVQRDLNQANLEYNKELAQNQMQWNIQGMKQAGVNPILAVNGGAHSASTANNAGQQTSNEAIQALTSVAKVALFLATKGKVK